MNIRTSAFIAPIAAGLDVFLVFFGMFLWSVAATAPAGLSTQPWLRGACAFVGAIAMIPAAATSLMLRVQRIDAGFIERVTGGIHVATFIAFCMGRGTLAKLFRLVRVVASNPQYPESLRCLARSVFTFMSVASAGLLVCLIALVVRRASA